MARFGTSYDKLAKLGAGGYVSGGGFSPDGLTAVCSNDISNGYIWGPSDTQWRPIFTTLSMPVGDHSPLPNNSASHAPPTGGYQITDSGTGCYAVAVANGGRGYFAFNGWLYTSTDYAVTLTRCNMTAKRMLPNENPGRYRNHKLVIDPTNSSKFLLGTDGDGVYYSTDAGATVTPLTITENNPAIESGISPHLVAINSTGTKFVYFTEGTGAFVSSTINGTYTLISGSPTNAQEMRFDPFDRLMICYSTTISHWNGTSWTSRTAPKDMQTIAVNPADINKWTGWSNNSDIIFTTDNGANFTLLNNISPSPIGIGYTAPVIKWLDEAPVKLFTSFVEYRPGVSNEAWVFHGTGIGKYTPVTSFVRQNITDQSVGIEQLVCNGVISTKRMTAPIAYVWDKTLFRLTDFGQFPVKNIIPAGAVGSGLCHSWQCDVSADGLQLVTNSNAGQGGTYQAIGYGDATGENWTAYDYQHPNGGIQGGMIAVNAQHNVIVLSPGVPGIYRKTATGPWSYLNIGGEILTNYVNASYTRRYIVTADKTQPGVFFIVINWVNQGSNNLNFRGLWKTTDGGDNWTRVAVGPLDSTTSGDFWHGKLLAIPGKTNELLYTSGKDYAGSPLRRFTGATTMTGVDIPNITDVWDIGFGVNEVGASYPVIFFYGKVSGGPFGIYCTVDNFATTELLSSGWPNHNIDRVQGIDGDEKVFKRCYASFTGSGLAVVEHSKKWTVA